LEISMVERFVGGACILAMIGAGIQFRRARPASLSGDRAAKRQVRLALLVLVGSAVVLVLFDSLR
jgi:hypothetical protein